MRKRIIALGCMLLTGLLIWKMPDVLSQYPVNRDGSMRERSWQGVLRVWVCQDWSSSAAGWVAKQSAAFEKANKGVHVSIRRVLPGAWDADGAVPPDVLVFSPGVLDDPRELLTPFADSDSFLSEAARSGRWMDEQYALPVALGGYAVLVNEAMWPAGTALGEPPPVKKQTRYVIEAGAGGPMAALLGWEEGVEAARGLSKPEGFGTVSVDSAYSTFVGGNVSVLVGTLDQTRRFNALVNAGRGFPFRVETPLSGFCDQVLLVGKVGNEPDKARDEMALAYIWALTGKAAQDTLLSVGLIPVRKDAVEASDATPTLKALQTRYRTELATPNAFGWGGVRKEFFDRALYAVMHDTAGVRDAIEQVR
ncbi:hypothetical protein AGMMS49992_05460 [Clostridia bacterium]|nr:hypothetical protein AGMMS49992_05460 [Clostridia bacterium]